MGRGDQPIMVLEYLMAYMSRLEFGMKSTLILGNVTTKKEWRILCKLTRQLPVRR